MPRYADVLEAKEMREKVVLQIAKALFNLDPTRKVIKSYRDLPAVNVPYVLIEYLPTSKNGISEYGHEIYSSGVDEFTEDVVVSQTSTFRIIAANNAPYDFLNDFVISRYVEGFWRVFFGDERIGINTISDIVDASIPMEGGEWEERQSCNITVNYLSKKSSVVNTIDNISYGFTVTGDPEKDDITGGGVV